MVFLLLREMNVINGLQMLVRIHTFVRMIKETKSSVSRDSFRSAKCDEGKAIRIVCFVLLDILYTVSYYARYANFCTLMLA